jgi:hypothetical protein
MEYLASIVIWCLAVFGFTNIMVTSMIMKPLRDWLQFSEIKKENGTVVSVVERKFSFFGKMITCVLCTGFWAGVFWGIYWDPFHLATAPYLMHMLFNGCLGSSVCWLIHIKTYPLIKGM